MVLNIVQTRSGVEASFEISSTDGVIATAAMTNNVTFGGTWLIAYKGTSFSMQYKRLAAVNNLSIFPGENRPGAFLKDMNI